MGVEYFNCDFCEEPVPDCASRFLGVVNLDEGLSVCEPCYDSLTDDGYLKIVKEEPDWHYLALTGGKVQLYKDWDALVNTSFKEFPDQFGCWKVLFQRLSQIC